MSDDLRAQVAELLERLTAEREKNAMLVAEMQKMEQTLNAERFSAAEELSEEDAYADAAAENAADFFDHNADDYETDIKKTVDDYIEELEDKVTDYRHEAEAYHALYEEEQKKVAALEAQLAAPSAAATTGNERETLIALVKSNMRENQIADERMKNEPGLSYDQARWEQPKRPEFSHIELLDKIAAEDAARNLRGTSSPSDDEVFAAWEAAKTKNDQHLEEENVVAVASMIRSRPQLATTEDWQLIADMDANTRERVAYSGEDFTEESVDRLKTLAVAVVADPAKFGDTGRKLDEIASAMIADKKVNKDDLAALSQVNSDDYMRTAMMAAGYTGRDVEVIAKWAEDRATFPQRAKAWAQENLVAPLQAAAEKFRSMYEKEAADSHRAIKEASAQLVGRKQDLIEIAEAAGKPAPDGLASVDELKAHALGAVTNKPVAPSLPTAEGAGKDYYTVKPADWTPEQREAATKHLEALKDSGAIRGAMTVEDFGQKRFNSHSELKREAAKEDTLENSPEPPKMTA